MTSSREASAVCDIGDSWRALLKRIRRGEWKKVKRHRYGMVKSEYARVRTSEGNGVLHVVYRGEFIPVRWLSKAWRELHKSPNVWIARVKGKKEVARYISHYMSKQVAAFVRLSYSAKWVFRGFYKVWYWIVRGHVHEGFASVLKCWYERIGLYCLRQEKIG